MGLKYSVESLDGIEDAQKALYVEKDGKFVLDVSDIPTPPPADKTGFLADLAKERKRRQELEKKVSKWEAIGKTDEEIADLITKADEREVSEAERKGEWDKLRAQMNDKHSVALKARDDEKSNLLNELKSRDSAIEDLMVNFEVTRALADFGGKPFLAKIVRDFIKVEKDDNGSYKLSVVDDKGGPRIGAKGEPLTVSELVGEMRSSDDYAPAFKGSGASGSGTPPGSSGSGRSGQKVTKADLQDRSKRAEYVEKYGSQAYFSLPEK